jgi:hypothetical protein
MTKSGGKAKVGQMGTIVPLRGTIVPQERVGTRTNEAAGLIVLSPNSAQKNAWFVRVAYSSRKYIN